MPRGKNYVNNNRGVSLQASKKKKATQMVACIYGAGCTRSDCIYRHPHGKAKSPAGYGQGVAEYQSKEPCMPYLAGMCTFTAAGCQKRHPPRVEAERLRAKYRSTKCRFGDGCRTKGCLYLHPDDLEDSGLDASAAEAAEEEEELSYLAPRSVPALAAVPATPPSSAWKPARPGLPDQYAAQPPLNALSASAGAFVPRSLSASVGAFVPSGSAGAISPSAFPADRHDDPSYVTPMQGCETAAPLQSDTTPIPKSPLAAEHVPQMQAPPSGTSKSLQTPLSVGIWAQQNQQNSNPWAAEGDQSQFKTPPSWK